MIYKLWEDPTYPFLGDERSQRPYLLLIHSSRGGNPTLTAEEELTSTLGWFKSSLGRPSSQRASANDVIAANGDRYEVVHPNHAAWGATYLNQRAVQIELVQQTIDTPFTDAQYETLIPRLKQLCDDYGIPFIHVMFEDSRGVMGHDETVQGRGWGKSDPGPMFEWEKVFVPKLTTLQQRIKDNADLAWGDLESIRKSMRPLSHKDFIVIEKGSAAIASIDDAERRIVDMKQAVGLE